jgi:hypothetical protein
MCIGMLREEWKEVSHAIFVTGWTEWKNKEVHIKRVCLMLVSSYGDCIADMRFWLHSMVNEMGCCVVYGT